MSTTRTFTYANESSGDGSRIEVSVNGHDDGFPVSLVVDNGIEAVGAVGLTTEEAEALSRALLLAVATADANDADDNDDCGECPDDEEFEEFEEASRRFAEIGEAERRENARFDSALLRSYNEDGDDIELDLDDEDA